MKPNIVCIGGGTGQSEILRGLKRYDCNITAIVAVTDSGRSTGVIRSNYGIPAPGDIRNCLAALSESEPLLQELFQHRFDKGKGLEGMSFGNLFLTALIKIKGDMVSAVEEASKILKIKGKVLPSTPKSTHVCAELEDGSTVEEELNVRNPNKAPIKRIFLKDKNVRASKDAIKAIHEANLIIIGPGSLYTSVLVHFLLPDLKKAIRESHAKKVFVCNLVTQAGQTDGYTTEKHVQEMVKYMGGNKHKGLDIVLLNSKPPSHDITKLYEKEGGFILKTDKHKIKELGVKIIERDILKNDQKKIVEWNKVSSIRHDPDKTAKVLLDIAGGKNGLKAVLLAAGNGTRLRPFSFSESKTMIHFLGKPLLAHHVDELINNGIKEIMIVCNPLNKKKIEEYFKKNYKEDIKFLVQKEQMGPSHALLSVREYVNNSHFIVKYGDSVSSEDETRTIIETFKKNKTDTVVTLREVTQPEEYGIARFSGKKLVEIVEKPEKDFPSKLANVGLCILDGEKFFSAIDKIDKTGWQKILPPQQYILQNNGQASYWITNAKRVDLGRAWNILEVNKLLIQRLGGKIESRNIAASASISKTCYISPNAVIMEGVKIEGHSSVEGYVGKGTIIKDSVVMSGTKIGKACMIHGSVIGRNNLIDDGFTTRTKGNDVKVYVKGRYMNPTIKDVGVFTGENVTIMEGITSWPGKMVFPNKLIKEDIKIDKIIRAILFDADNTLYATKNVARGADMNAMRFFSKQTSMNAQELYSEWKKIVGPLTRQKDPTKRTREYSYMLLAKRFRLKDVDKAFDLFVRKLINNIELMKGFDSALPFIQPYKLAVMSEDSSDLTLPKLRRFNLLKKFDLVVTSDKIGAMKPSKEYYDVIFKRFNVEPNECLVIGDNYEKDLEIAQKMGATTINFGKDDKRAHFSMKDYNELPAILGGI